MCFVSMAWWAAPVLGAGPYAPLCWARSVPNSTGDLPPGFRRALAPWTPFCVRLNPLVGLVLYLEAMRGPSARRQARRQARRPSRPASGASRLSVELLAALFAYLVVSTASKYLSSSSRLNELVAEIRQGMRVPGKRTIVATHPGKRRLTALDAAGNSDTLSMEASVTPPPPSPLPPVPPPLFPPPPPPALGPLVLFTAHLQGFTATSFTQAAQSAYIEDIRSFAKSKGGKVPRQRCSCGAPQRRIRQFGRTPFGHCPAADARPA